MFKNVGAEAGASLGHTHSQIISTPIVPELIRSELSCAEEHSRNNRCVYCDLVQQELADGLRVVARSANFVVVMAFAPRFAYEMWLLPTAHDSRYESLCDSGASELAILLKQVLRALDVVQNAPAYNWYLHTTPLHLGELSHYHWHLEVLTANRARRGSSGATVAISPLSRRTRGSGVACGLPDVATM